MFMVPCTATTVLSSTLFSTLSKCSESIYTMIVISIFYIDLIIIYYRFVCIYEVCYLCHEMDMGPQYSCLARNNFVMYRTSGIYYLVDINS